MLCVWCWGWCWGISLNGLVCCGWGGCLVGWDWCWWGNYCVVRLGDGLWLFFVWWFVVVKNLFWYVLWVLRKLFRMFFFNKKRYVDFGCLVVVVCVRKCGDWFVWSMKIVWLIDFVDEICFVVIYDVIGFFVLCKVFLLVICEV